MNSRFDYRENDRWNEPRRDEEGRGEYGNRERERGRQEFGGNDRYQEENRGTYYGNRMRDEDRYGGYGSSSRSMGGGARLDTPRYEDVRGFQGDRNRQERNWGGWQGGRPSQEEARMNRPNYDPGQGAPRRGEYPRDFDYGDYERPQRSRNSNYSRYEESYPREGEREWDIERGSRSPRQQEGERYGDRETYGGNRDQGRDRGATWRQFEDWGNEDRGDSRSQGLGFHRADSYHDRFWSEDEGPRGNW